MLQLCYGSIFFSFLSRHHPSLPPPALPILSLNLFIPRAGWSFSSSLLFWKLEFFSLHLAPHRISLSLSLSSKMTVSPRLKFFFFHPFVFDSIFAAIFSVCNLGKINNYQDMINYIIHYIHGGSQTIKKYVPRPLYFLVREKRKEKNTKEKERKKMMTSPPPFSVDADVSQIMGQTPPLKCYFQY